MNLPEKSQNFIPKGCRESHLPLALPEAALLKKNGVLIAGRSTLVPGYHIERAGRDHHLFHVSVSGKGRLFHEAGTTELLPGNVFFAPAQSRYRFEIASKSWSTIWFHLDPTHSLWKRAGKNLLVYHTTHHPLFDALCACLIAETLSENHSPSHLASGSADLLVRLLVREAGFALGSPTGRMSGLTDKLFSEVHASLDRKWTLGELAARSGLSARHLTRVVQDLFKTSPMGQVVKMRMEEAAKLLLYTTHSLGVVAASVGYADSFSFAAAFKRQLGISPGAYRKKKAAPI
ncbi:MAG: helix-turn-helix domain-containing protein [Spirochaetia bacterium]|nr:helix-turn-helix domain-containing protein [Spirochaetia bacterium]